MWTPLVITQALGIPNFLLYLIVIVVVAYLYGTWTHRYFDGTNIKGPKPWPFIGNLPELSQRGLAIDEQLVQKYGKVFSFYMGRKPSYVIADPAVIRDVCVKEFPRFINRNSEGFVIDDIVANAVSHVKDQQWKGLRNVITPTFSSGKLKKMMPLISDCSKTFVANIDMFAKLGKDFEMKAVCGNYTMDVIASTAFAVKVESRMNEAGDLEDASSEFVKHAHKIMSAFSFDDPKLAFMFAFPQLAPLFERLGWSFFDKDAVQFFENNIYRILEMRQNEKNPGVDFLQLMLDAHKLEDEDEKNEQKISIHADTSDERAYTWNVGKKAMTKKEILANAFIFFVAGYETTASTLSFCFYLLALHQDVQDRLREEIDVALERNKGQITYEVIAQMIYLDQCVNETLRMYPPAPRTDRKCGSDCTIGDYNFKKGDLVNISVWGVHYNEEYWPEPHKFDPDRFAPENKQNIVNYSFLPFGIGPRNCIGMRLAYLETKIGVIEALRNFKLTRCDKTEVPITLKKTGMTSAKNGIWMHAERR